MADLKVLIVGASIAGPTTAYWLSKTGAKITIIERFPKLRSGGQAVDIRSAGVSVMRRMPGMEDEVRAKIVQEEGLSFVRKDGRPYGIIRATGNPDQQSLISEFEILRGELAEILYNFTRDHENIRYIFGEQIASMRHKDSSKEGPITIEFANGYESSTYDLVIACDGATSRTRAMGYNCGVRDHVFSTNFWTAYYSTKRDLLQGSRIGQGYSAPGGRTISIGSDPSGFSRVMLIGLYPKDQVDAMLAFQQAAAQGTNALKEYITEHYRGVGWKASEALDELQDSDDFYASEIVQVKMPTLHKGRFVLVGDAGYAAGPTGCGTSLALLGSYILAGEIASHPNDIPAALEGYEQRMQPTINEMQRIPPFISSIFAPQTAWGIWLRNHLFALIAWTGIAEFLQKYLGAAFANVDKFPLPEYRELIGDEEGI